MGEETGVRPVVTERNLWIGLSGTVAVWTLLGIGNIAIAYWACRSIDAVSVYGFRGGLLWLALVVTIILLGFAAICGLVSYRNWVHLSGGDKLLQADGDSRQGFLALLGIFVSVTLGLGELWLTLPLLILNFCVRGR